MATKTKSAIQSKTIWFNILAGLGTVAAAQLPALAPFLTPGVFAGVSMGVAAVNVVLRAATDSAIASGSD